jgi:hypothetical protein
MPTSTASHHPLQVSAVHQHGLQCVINGSLKSNNAYPGIRRRKQRVAPWMRFARRQLLDLSQLGFEVQSSPAARTTQTICWNGRVITVNETARFAAERDCHYSRNREALVEVISGLAAKYYGCGMSLDTIGDTRLLPAACSPSLFC